jgi:hypothetical protein
MEMRGEKRRGESGVKMKERHGPLSLFRPTSGFVLLCSPAAHEELALFPFWVVHTPIQAEHSISVPSLLPHASFNR